MWLLALYPTAWSAPNVIELAQAGRQQTDVVIEHFGRVAFEVKSANGASLQLVDRSEGPGQTAGRIGEQDGRIDRFVDVGDIRIITRGPAEVDGNLRVIVTPFERLGSSPQLQHHKPQHTELRDKTERAWWIDHTDESRPLHLEAIGRHASDLRLWRDGTWLVDATPSCTALTPVEGQPLQHCTLNVSTEPGLYQAVVYGDPGPDWANEARDTSLQIQWGLPERSGSGQHTGRLGPTGRYVISVASTADTAHLSLSEHAPTKLHFQGFGSDPFQLGRSEAAITDTSRQPVATAKRTTQGRKVLAVEGAPGQRFSVSWFRAATRFPVRRQGELLITSRSTGRWQDHFPPTAVLTRREDHHDVLLAETAVNVASGHVFRERFNLLTPTSFLLRVEGTSPHRLSLTEGKAKLRVYPFFTTPPNDFRRPDTRSQTWEEQLSPGLYVVEILPETPGVTTLEIDRNGWFDLANRVVANNEEVTLPQELRATFQKPCSKSATLYVFHQDEIELGVDLRNTPLDAQQAHTFFLEDHESWTSSISTPVPILLQARLPNGEPIEIEVNGNRSSTITVQPGSWPLTLHNPGEPVVITLAPVVLPPEPIPLPSGRLEALPDFPLLRSSQKSFADLEQNTARTYKLSVEQDGLYHLQTTGLLATKGSLRSRVLFDLGEGVSNGVGRNFRISRFLLSGDYQVTVGVWGESEGHLGLELANVLMLDGGLLGLNEDARITLPPEAGVSYPLVLTEQTALHIASSSPQNEVPCRLEDADGWPLVRPLKRCDLDVVLEPGDYVLRSLPTSVLSKRLTTLRTQPLPEPKIGNGPFLLPLGQLGQKTWVEPVGAGERPEDLWDLNLPAAGTLSLQLSPEMKGELRSDDRVIARLVPGREWSGPVEAGPYSLHLQATRRGTGIPYTVLARTEAMMVGQTRSVNSPTLLPIRIGKAGLITLRSEGKADLRARLLDADGDVVAANDDRPDGWDFQIASWLEPGDYQLELNHTGKRNASRVILEAPHEEAGPALVLNAPSVSLPVSATPTVHNIELRKGKKLLALHARSDQNIGLSLQMQTPTGWVNLGDDAGRRVALIGRRTPGAALRVRLWSIDGRSGTASLHVDVPTKRTPTESTLRNGIETDAPTILSARALSPGLFRVHGDRTQMRLCPSVGRACEAMEPIVALDANTQLFGSRFKLERVDLKDSVPFELTATPTLLETGLDGLVALSVRTGTTLPGLHLQHEDGMASGHGAALAIGRGEAALWGSGGSRIRGVELAEEVRDWSGKQELGLQIPAQTAVRIPLSRVANTYPLALERGLFAALDGGSVWADEDALQAQLSGAVEMLLVNPTDTPLRATLSPPKDHPRPLHPDGALEWFAVSKGRAVFPVEPGSGTLHTHNAELVFRTAEGTLQAGTSIDATPGGWVEVRHSRGWTALWSEVHRPGPRQPPTRQLRFSEGGLVRITAEGPFAVQLDALPHPQVVLRPEGGNVDLLIPEGGTKVGIRPLGDQPDVRVARRQLPISPLQEGLGPELLLQGGQDAWFSFEVERDGLIGVGVRAEADRVEARIVSTSGEEVARGVVAMAELQAGTWYLVLSQSPDAPPVRVRPALAGLDRPDTGPPDEVIRTYLQRAGFQADGGAR